VEPRPVDVRILASTREDLERRAAAGAFRADLLYRLAAVRIHVPPLRSRREDIPLLAAHFLALHSRRLEREPPVLDAGALALLREHDWPGNVRQLEAALLRLLVTVSPGAAVRVDDLRTVLPALPGGRLAFFDEEAVAGRDLRHLRRELDRVYLTRLFRDSGGDLRVMARALGVKLSNLYHWLRRVGIDIRTLRREG
jgi:DNA-binding NtrC family response regulator